MAPPHRAGIHRRHPGIEARSVQGEGRHGHGIASDDDVIILGGDIHIVAVKDGVHANDNISVAGCVVRVSNANDGLESEGDLVINGGQLVLSVADDGLQETTGITYVGVDPGRQGLPGRGPGGRVRP